MRKIFKKITVNCSLITDNWGFTLIELLIVTTIIILLSGLSLSYYNNFTEQQKLKTETRKLVDVLELAKKKASAGDLSNRNCGGGFNGYEMDITANSYSMFLRCGGARITPAISDYSIPSDSSISIVSGTGQYFFRSLTTQSSSGSIQLKNSSISKCLTISLSSSGIISFDEILSSC